jgi:MATE family multidrug resistance protein
VNDGAPLTRRHALSIALPMVFANAVVPLAGVVDTFVVGAVGDDSDLGGVALGTTIFNVAYFTLYFLRMSATGLTAQARGRGDEAEVKRVLLRVSVLAAALGALGVLARPLLRSAGLAVLEGTPAVDAAATAYFDARTLGLPAALALLGIGGWLIGLGRSGAVLAVHATFSGVNVALDFALGLGLGWGVTGVGLATAIAEAVAVAVGALFIRGEIRRRGGGPIGLRALGDLAAWRRLGVVNADLVIRSWSLLAGIAWFINSGARQGTAVLAGNHVLLQFVTLWAFVLDAWAFTAEGEVGRAVGVGSVPRLRRAIRVTSEMALASGAGFMVATATLGPAALGGLVADAEARAAALRFLPYCAAIPFVGAAAWQLDGIFIGATRSRALRNGALAALGLYVAADLALAPTWGPDGTWLAFLGFYAARALTLAMAYPALERAVGSGAS